MFFGSFGHFGVASVCMLSESVSPPVIARYQLCYMPTAAVDRSVLRNGGETCGYPYMMATVGLASHMPALGGAQSSVMVLLYTKSLTPERAPRRSSGSRADRAMILLS